MTQAALTEECPDENALLDFAAGALGEPAREQLEAHLADCAGCCLVLGESAGSIAPAEATARPSARLSPELAGRYELLREIGSGGQAMVYAAFDHQLKREVALKLPVATDADRFLREAQLAAKLDHPGIVTVYEIGTRADGSLYATQRLVRPEPGASRPRTLRDAFVRAITAAARVELIPRLISVAEAVAYAHAQSVVHHDLKPENVAVGEHGETVVLDWGLAEELAEGKAPAEVRGTPGYMSPEQARGLRGDSTTDVYSLGAMLYELLSGQRPASPSRPLRDVEPTVPPALASIAHRALAVEPADRYPNATGFAADLSRWLSGGMVDAYDYALRERIGLSLRRHRQVVRFVAVLAGILLAAASVAFVQNLRTRAALAQTLQEKGTVAQRRNAWDTAAALFAASLRLKDAPAARYGLSATLGHSKIVARVAPPGVSAIAAIAVSPDGSQLAIGAQDGRILLYAKGGATPEVELTALTDVVRALAFTPDGKWLVGGGDNGRLMLFELGTPNATELFRTTTPLNAVTLAPDGTWVVAVFEDGSAGRWSLATHERLAHWQAHQHPVYGVAVDPKGTTLATAGWDKTVKLWTLDGEPRATLTGHTESVLSVAYSPTGQLASGSRDTTVRIWPADGTVSHVLSGHTQKVNAVAWLGDERLASTGDDGFVRYWSLTDFLPLNADAEAIDEDGLTLATSSGRVLVGGGRGVVASLAEPKADTLGELFFQHFDLAADGTTVGVGNAQWVRLDPFEGKVVERRPIPGAMPRDLRAVPGGGMVITTYVENSDNALEWLKADGTLVPIATFHQITAMALTPEADQVAVGADDSTVRFYKVSTSEPTLTLTGHTSPVFDIVFSADRIFTASYDKTIGIWDRKTGERRDTLTGHWSGVRSIALSPDGQYAVSGGWDKTVRIWGLSPPRLLKTLQGHEGYVTAAAFDDTGRRVVSTGWDGRVIVWDVASGAALVTLATNELKLRSARFLGPDRVIAGGTQLFRFQLTRRDPDDVLRSLAIERGAVFEATQVVLVPFGSGLLR